MPTYDHAHLVRAMLLDGYLDKPQEAIAEFEEVLRLSPTHAQRPVIENELARLRTLDTTSPSARPAQPGTATAF
jgi:predicted RNA polymerase sigma factor